MDATIIKMRLLPRLCFATLAPPPSTARPMATHGVHAGPFVRRLLSPPPPYLMRPNMARVLLQRHQDCYGLLRPANYQHVKA
eukprot:7386419-Pyramimonas_sp.AAC.1